MRFARQLNERTTHVAAFVQKGPGGGCAGVIPARIDIRRHGAFHPFVVIFDEACVRDAKGFVHGTVAEAGSQTLPIRTSHLLDGDEGIAGVEAHLHAHLVALGGGLGIVGLL